MRVLYIQKDVDYDPSLQNMLERKGYIIDLAFDFEEAEYYFNNHHYDGIIVDSSANEEGIELARCQSDSEHKVPILLILNKNDLATRREARQYGINEFVNTPVALESFMARFSSMVKAGIQDDIISREEASIKLGNTSLNSIDYTLSTEYGSVDVSSKEYQILEILMGRPGILFDVDYIYSEIWTDYSTVEKNIVWVYLSYIRTKLKKINSNLVIRSKRGVGYIMGIQE